MPTAYTVTCHVFRCGPLVTPPMPLTWDMESADQVLLGPACHGVGGARILGIV